MSKFIIIVMQNFLDEITKCCVKSFHSSVYVFYLIKPEDDIGLPERELHTVASGSLNQGVLHPSEGYYICTSTEIPSNARFKEYCVAQKFNGENLALTNLTKLMMNNL